MPPAISGSIAIKQTDIDRIADWLIRCGLEGTPESELLRGFCERCKAAGLPISRALALIDTLHPVHEGTVFRWRDDGEPEEPVRDYGPSDEGDAARIWQTSPFFALLQSGKEEMRRRLAFGDPADFEIFREMKAEGHTDYVLLLYRFAPDEAIGEMDSVYSSWATRDPAGFSEAGMAALRRLVPALSLAIKTAALAKVAANLVSVYLGRDAGRRVLQGRIRRGVADRIEAVLWFSDLRSFTTITDSARPGEIIPLLNDYAEAVITAVQDHGGDVLKLIGDGTLAIFRSDDASDASAKALHAVTSMRAKVGDLNERRRAEEQPTSTVYVGLHAGEVYYGNIGSVDRLDFTVVGPAVNEASRIASMCRSVDRPVLMSSAFALTLPAADRQTLVSVGRYALRGVGHAEELFTIDPGLLQPG